MNTANTRHPSGPECARYRSLLPQFQQETLSPADERTLRAHLATCAYCRAHLAAYDRLDAALRISLDRYTPTTPSADDLVRIAMARVSPASSTSSAAMGADHHTMPRVRQRENAMFDPPDAIYDTPTMPQAAYRPPRNTRTRPVLATIAALLLIGLAAALFTMFARPSTSPAHNSTPTAALQPTATIQPTPAPTQANTQNGIYSGHPCSTDTSGQTSYVRIGDLRVSQVSFGEPAYPANELPANLDPSKPYQLPDNLSNPPTPPVNPTASYSLTICNTSSATDHTLRGLTVRIAAFSAYNGPLNTYMFCDTFYQRPGGVTNHGCGGGMDIDEQLQASFAADATTDAIVTTIQGNTAGNAPPLPVILGPGQLLNFVVDITPPTLPGTYTFAFGLNYDTVTAAPISTMQPTLFDSSAVKWIGQNCTKPALLSQIPTTDTTGRYVCAP